MKERIKSMSFWVGILGAIFLILSAFGVEIGDETANSVINGVCSLLVVLGIVSAPQKDLTDMSDAEREQSADPAAEDDAADNNVNVTGER